MSNMTNLRAASDVDAIIRQQGWNNDTYCRVLCDFITLQQLWPAVLEYCRERANQENEECSGDNPDPS